MSLKKPGGRFSANILADFRPRLWPIFGQSFGQISAKVLVRFRPKPWPNSDTKNVHFWIFVLAFSENSNGRFPISAWPFSDFGQSVFRFRSGVWGPKSWPKTDQTSWPKTDHSGTECERARNLGSSASNFFGRFPTKKK